MCDTNCSCSSNQKSNKCNSKKYTSPLTYDGEKFVCSALSSIKKNCTPLNTLLKLFGDKICELLNRPIAQSIAYYDEQAENFSLNLKQFTIIPVTGTSFTIPEGEDGEYEFVFEGTLRAPGFLFSGCSLYFFKNAVQNGKRRNFTSQKNLAGDFDETYVSFFLSKIPLVAGDVVDIRVLGSSIDVDDSNQLLNTTYKLTKIS